MLLKFIYFTLYINGSAHQSYFTRDNYIFLYHRKKTVCLFSKIVTLFSFERCLVTHKKKSAKKLNQLNNLRIFSFLL